jgi:putative radical SAM enzyme (TIGR03279 family)
MGFTVKSIDKHSAAWRAGLREGDRVLSFNGEDFVDYIDYVYFSSEDRLTVEYESRGRVKKALLKKDPEEPMGLEFEEGLLGKKRVCRNKCVFCFVDQLPKGMRRTLYVKDEDWRCSFIMGNYVTLSDIGEAELNRIIARKASPLYISVHAADEETRKKMIGNMKARPVMETLERLKDGGIKFHTQAVICPGYNDGKTLQNTMESLYGLYPSAMSLAVVPVGLTAHRRNLLPLKAMDKSSAEGVLKLVEDFAAKALKEKGTRFVFASDEIYIRAGKEMPAYEAYEDFPQIENGVGVTRKLEAETESAMEDYANEKAAYKKVSFATGVDACPYIEKLAQKLADRYKMEINVYPVENRFFGESVTVAGLLTGRDIRETLKNRDLGEALLLPDTMFRDREDVFLDDMDRKQMKEALGVDVLAVPVDGYALVETLIEKR